MAGEPTSYWWIGLALASVAACGAALGNIINGWFNIRGQAIAAKANLATQLPKNANDAQKIFVDSVLGFVNELQEERNDLSKRLDRQQEKIEALQREVIGLGEHVTHLTRHIGELESQLRDHGVTPPSRPVPLLRAPF